MTPSDLVFNLKALEEGGRTSLLRTVRREMGRAAVSVAVLVFVLVLLVAGALCFLPALLMRRIIGCVFLSGLWWLRSSLPPLVGVFF